MMFYPTPHTVILGDRCIPYEENVQGTLFMNPGPFSVNDYQFMVYSPSKRISEMSQVE
jgi:hypothetical protein